jgi:hypothetical protein
MNTGVIDQFLNTFIRAAKQAGGEAVEVRPDGTIVVLLKSAPVAPEDPPEPAATA